MVLATENRISSIDFLRFFGAVAVIIRHTRPFYFVINPPHANMIYQSIAVVINGLSRLAVPVFFIIAGYFLKRSAAKYGLGFAYKRYVLRIIFIFFVPRDSFSSK